MAARQVQHRFQVVKNRETGLAGSRAEGNDWTTVNGEDRQGGVARRPSSQARLQGKHESIAWLENSRRLSQHQLIPVNLSYDSSGYLDVVSASTPVLLC